MPFPVRFLIAAKKAIEGIYVPHTIESIYKIPTLNV